MSPRVIRALIVIGQLDRGGAERQIHELATRLDPRSVRASVATFTPGGHYQRLLESAGIEVAVIEKAGWRELTAVSRLAALMRRLRADVAHAFLFPACWRTVAAARRAGVRSVVCSVRSTGLWMNARHRLMDRTALRHASLVVANAPAVRDDLIRTGRIAPGRIQVIMNGVDTAVFSPGGRQGPDRPLRREWSVPGDAPLVGFVGSLRQAKDPALFLDLAHLVAARLPASRFVLVGDGPMRPRLEARAAGPGLSGRVVFAGSRTDMPDVYRSLDLLAVTSEREGCCNAILEAMATGVPVVATAVGGNPDLIDSGRTGILFPHGDAASGGEAALSLLADPARAAGIAEAARRRVTGELSIDAMVGATARLYETLA